MSRGHDTLLDAYWNPSDHPHENNNRVSCTHQFQEPRIGKDSMSFLISTDMGMIHGIMSFHFYGIREAGCAIGVRSGLRESTNQGCCLSFLLTFGLRLCRRAAYLGADICFVFTIVWDINSGICNLFVSSLPHWADKAAVCDMV